MTISSIAYQNTAKEIGSLYSKNAENILSHRISELTDTQKSASDSISLSSETKEINDLGLNLNSSNTVKENSSINFEYNLSNSDIQVQSKGKYNLTKNTGEDEISINPLGTTEYQVAKISTLPKEVKIKLDFSLFEQDFNTEENKTVKSTDFLSLSMKILKNIIGYNQESENQSTKNLQYTQQLVKYSTISQNKESNSSELLSWYKAISENNSLYSNNNKNNTTEFTVDTNTYIQLLKRNYLMKMGSIKMEFIY
jgi:hypothetical protein